MESLRQIEKKDGEIVPARNDEERNQEQDKWGIMDVLDEELIRADLAGTDIDDLVYSFKIGDKLIEDLTSQGAIAMARIAVQRLPISILCDRAVTEERPKAWKASVKCAYVTERGNRFEFWGSFVQPKEIFNKKGEFIREDPKAEQIAEVKATRNGILKVFPKTMRVEYIKMFKGEGKVKAFSPDKVKDAAQQAKVVGSGTAKPASQPEKKENQAQTVAASWIRTKDKAS